MTRRVDRRRIVPISTKGERDRLEKYRGSTLMLSTYKVHMCDYSGKKIEGRN